MSYISVYLDSSDYLSLYSTQDQVLRNIRRFLLDMVDKDKIKIYLSFSVVMEVIQKCEEQYKSDRIDRGVFLKDLTRGNSLPFLMDIESSDKVYSDQFRWSPMFVYDMVNIEYIVDGVIGKIIKLKQLHKSYRKKLKTKKGRKRFFKKMEPIDTTDSEFHFPDEFNKEEILYRYLCSEVTEKYANDKLQLMFNDPVLFFLNYYDVAQLKNMFVDIFHKASLAVHNECEKMINIGRRKGKDISREINCSSFKKDKKIPRIFYCILSAFIRDNYKNPHYQLSDAADIMHAVYLPYVDLWRGDNYFSNLLIRQDVPYLKKIVPKLSMLPQRIEQEISKRNS